MIHGAYDSWLRLIYTLVAAATNLIGSGNLTVTFGVDPAHVFPLFSFTYNYFERGSNSWDFRFPSDIQLPESVTSYLMDYLSELSYSLSGFKTKISSPLVLSEGPKFMGNRSRLDFQKAVPFINITGDLRNVAHSAMLEASFHYFPLFDDSKLIDRLLQDVG